MGLEMGECGKGLKGGERKEGSWGERGREGCREVKS